MSSEPVHKYSEVVNFKQNQKIQFPDFSIIFLEKKDPEEDAEVKSTSSIMYRFFLISNKDGSSEKINIIHGQLPPAPYELKTGGGKFTINTFSSSKEQRLFPDKLEVVKN